MNQQLEEIKKLIENSEIVEFGDFGEGVSESWILKAETYLGLSLPDKYKWWIRNYGGGEIGEEEIYSIYEIDFEEVSGGDIVNMSNINSSNGILPLGKVAVSEPIGGGEIYYFDLTSSDEKVFVLHTETSENELYADDFLQFLEKRIRYYS